MCSRPYCRNAFEGNRMSIRRTPGKGACPAWIFLGLASATGVATAAGPAAPDAHASTTASDLDRVVVTATRQADDALVVPTAVDVVGAGDLHRAQPGLSLSESLQRVPGVVARDRQNQAQGLQVSIRGFGARSS